MSISTIILGKNKDKIDEQILNLINDSRFALTNNPDLLEIEKLSTKKSIGIEEVREIGKFLKILPISHNQKIALVREAGILTNEAQNSLLKILEEPPEYARIILISESREKFLPTVISRCQIIEIKEEKNLDKNSTNFLKMSVSEKFDWAETTSKLEKDEIIQILNKILLEIKNNEPKISVKSISLLLEVTENISKYNLNTRLALEYLSLNFEKKDNKL